MATLKPWMRIGDLRREMDRMFEGMSEPRWGEFPAAGEWMPSLDLSETKDALVLKLEVPGMEPKDTQIALQENLLTVKGEKKQEKEDKDERYHRVERSYGAFTRTVRLPVAVDAEKVSASFKNGLLIVTLAKTAGAKGVTIPVKAE